MAGLSKAGGSEAHPESTRCPGGAAAQKRNIAGLAIDAILIIEWAIGAG